MKLFERVRKLGYCLMYGSFRGPLGNGRFAYRTSPADGNGGGTNYFANRRDVLRWVRQVEQIREWQKSTTAS